MLSGCLRHPPEPCAGWTLTSISGFSQAFARAVDSAVAIRSTSAAGGAVGGGGSGAAALAHRPPPAHLGHGLSQGVASLAEGVAAGITGVVRAPIEVRKGNGAAMVCVLREEKINCQLAELVRCRAVGPAACVLKQCLACWRASATCRPFHRPIASAGLQQRHRCAGRPGTRPAGRCRPAG